MTNDQIDQLERLARMRAEGTLDATEYEVAKSAVLSRQVPSTASIAKPANNPSDASVRQKPLSATWQLRFDFYDACGRPGSASANTAQRRLPIGERMRTTFSVLGFFFGPIYLLVLGLWRPAITVTVGWIALALGLSGMGVSDDLLRALGAGIAGLCATITVPLYYEKVRFGIHSWNPFFFFACARER